MRNVQRFIAHVYHSVPYSFAICIVTTGAAGQPDPSGGNTDDDEFRSQFLQDYIEATLQSIRYSALQFIG
jgi:hypothetical protein